MTSFCVMTGASTRKLRGQEDGKRVKEKGSMRPRHVMLCKDKRRH